MKSQLAAVAAAFMIIAMFTTALSASRVPSSHSADGPLVNIVTVGDEMVGITPLERSARLFVSLPEFVSTAPVIVEGRVIRTTEIAAEVQPSASREGALPGEGPELYGAIDFEVVSVLKGDPLLKNVRLVYWSGKRDGDDKGKRIAYTHDELAAIQLPTGELRPAGALNNKTFLLFLQPNQPDADIVSNIRPQEGTYVLSANGLAEVTNNGRLKFGTDERAPIAPDSNPGNRVKISVAEVKAAIR